MSIDYSKIIKRSWEVTWKNKWLWVPALVLATFTGGGYSGGGGGNSSSNSEVSPTGSPMPNFDPTNLNDIKDKTSYVLGTATDYFSNWFSGITFWDWTLLISVFLLTFLLGIVIIWVLTNWAKGALIFGFDEADSGKEITLSSISPYGLTNIKKLILFNLISAGMSFLLVLLILLAVGLGFLISNLLGSIGTVIVVLLGILAFFFLIFVLLIFTMITIYAERLIVLRGLSPWEAWKKGLSLSKGNFISTLLMGIINSSIGCGAGCLQIIVLLIAFSVPGFLLIYPIFKNGFVMPTGIQMVAIIIMLILFATINTVLKSIFVVFNYGNWNLFFKEILDNKQEK